MGNQARPVSWRRRQEEVVFHQTRRGQALRRFLLDGVEIEAGSIYQAIGLWTLLKEDSRTVKGLDPETVDFTDGSSIAWEEVENETLSDT